VLLRSVGAGIARGSVGFRRVRGHADMRTLIAALDRCIKQSNLDAGLDPTRAAERRPELRARVAALDRHAVHDRRDDPLLLGMQAWRPQRRSASP